MTRPQIIKSTTVERLTLDATVRAGLDLLKILDALIEEKRCIKDSQEREHFIKFLSYSTLGLGVEKPFIIVQGDSPGSVIVEKLLDIESMGRRLAYETNPAPAYNFGAGKIAKSHPIDVYFRTLRNALFPLFAQAIQTSLFVSKEKDGTSRSGGFDISATED